MSNNLIILILAVILLVLGYFIFIKPSDFALSSQAANPMADQMLLQTQVFIERRTKLDSVAISSELFSDPRFTSLRSFSPALTEQTLGKPTLFTLPAGLAPAVSSDGE
jgi:hypothetical protein